MRNKYKAALLLIDFFNPMDFEGGAALARAADEPPATPRC
jgi:hypothetical protein